MRHGRVLGIAVIGAWLLAGIGSGGAEELGRHATAKLPAPKFLYTIGDGDIGAYSINARSGKPTVLASSPFNPFNASPCPDLAAATPTGAFLIIPDACNDDIVVVAINSDGSLTPVVGSPFPTGTGNFNVQQPLIDPSGKFLYVPEDNSPPTGQVLGFTIGADGALTPIAGSPFPAAGSDERLAITPDGKFLFVGDANSTDTTTPTLTIFSVDPSTGVLTPTAASPFPIDSAPSSLAVTPSGQFLYVSSADANEIDGFSIDAAGGVTPLAGLPVVSGIGPHSISISADGKLLFVANNGDLDVSLNGSVGVFAINATTGALTPAVKSPFATGTNPKEVAADPSGKFLYATNEDANTVGGFKVAKSGKITQIKGSPFSTNVGSEGIVITH